ncbi:MAG: hypothetical protein MJB14_04085 [Spirochaetes bacterium]|nr:hypothetical protein [Spirochaetota bacterium]
MKKIIVTILILAFLLSSCKDSKQTTEEKTDSKEQSVSISIPPEKVTQYAYPDWVLTYEKKEDIGKNRNQVKEAGNKYYYLRIGDKVTVIEESIYNKKPCYLFQLPDDSQYWVEKENLVEGFVVITKVDGVDTYAQPDTDYATAFNMQVGDFGIYKEDKNGFVKVDFKAYRLASQEAEKRTWVGEKWIQEGYITTIKVAKEAYYLYLAYFYMIQKNNPEKAIQQLEAGLELHPDEMTEITHVLKQYKAELEALITNE